MGVQISDGGKLKEVEIQQNDKKNFRLTASKDGKPMIIDYKDVRAWTDNDGTTYAGESYREEIAIQTLGNYAIDDNVILSTDTEKYPQNFVIKKVSDDADYLIIESPGKKPK